MADEFPPTTSPKHPDYINPQPETDELSLQQEEGGQHKSLPLPYDVPPALPESLASTSGLLTPATGNYPRVPKDKWARPEDFDSQKMFASLTGLRPATRPRTRALKPPRRFRPVTRWRSITLLCSVLLLSALSCIGVLKLVAGGVSLLHPGVTVTVTPPPTASPTRTPSAKK